MKKICWHKFNGIARYKRARIKASKSSIKRHSMIPKWNVHDATYTHLCAKLPCFEKQYVLISLPCWKGNKITMTIRTRHRNQCVICELGNFLLRHTFFPFKPIEFIFIYFYLHKPLSIYELLFSVWVENFTKEISATVDYLLIYHKCCYDFYLL